MKQTALALFISVFTLSLGFGCGGGKETTVTSPAEDSVSTSSAGTEVPTVHSTEPTGSQTGDATLHSVSLEDPGGSGSYRFEPASFIFGVGETVTFALTSESEFHTFTISELGIDRAVEAQSEDTFTFTFTQAGTYTLTCIPHGTLGMEGTITVQ